MCNNKSVSISPPVFPNMVSVYQIYARRIFAVYVPAVQAARTLNWQCFTSGKLEMQQIGIELVIG